jgi:hypothetical protein
MTLLPEDALRPDTSWELDSIAHSLVLEGVYGNPYVVPSGPTGHLPPIPPFILAALYQVFGITALAATLAWALRLLFQAVLLGLLPWIGLRVGVGWQAGLVGGLAGALWPQYVAHGESEAALLLGLLVLGIAGRWTELFRSDGSAPALPRPAASLALGAGFGIAFHAQPAFLPVFLGYVAFELWRRGDRARWRSNALVVLGALLVCIPWGVRNVRSLDAVVFVRSNFGLEMHVGNHEGAQASIDHPHYRDHRKPRVWSHPRLDADDAIEIRDSGEIAYMRRKGRQAGEWIAAHPGEFTRLTAARIRHFWVGSLDDPAISLAFLGLFGCAALGLWGALRRLPADRVALLWIPLLAYPPVYYLVPWQHRYRFPIEWILFLLAGAGLWWLVSGAMPRNGAEHRDVEVPLSGREQA